MTEVESHIRDFRRALGRFVTGVAVVTALDNQKQKVGLTINSFSSVSLHPALVLWCIANDAMSYETFMEAEHFAINILGSGQQDLSSRFALSGGDKFEDLQCHEGVTGVPVFDEFAACFECQTEYRYEGGDHKIIVGRVLEFEERDVDPLVYYRGDFIS